MERKISITPSEVWDYFCKYKNDLISSMHEIASNYAYGTKIYVTNDNGLLKIIVCADDEEIYGTFISNKGICEETVEKIYDNYLTYNAIAILAGGYNDDASDAESALDDEIGEREMELDDAVFDLLYVVTEDSVIVDEEIVDDVKEHILEYIARKHGIPIRRPMFLEAEDGTEFYAEYPYPSMIFEDEDNPIYK